MDARVTWGFGLAAVACLIANFVASRRRPWPCRIERDEPRAAA